MLDNKLIQCGVRVHAVRVHIVRVHIVRVHIVRVHIVLMLLGIRHNPRLCQSGPGICI